ncbi:hypothetical protein [Thioalkalivibrio sp. ALJ16]|uniref:hypothetical protein n=1 Tax=Thioalkalivibrio sp. ALJ16 TaxID=1158762 RepID=UPI00036CC9DE|nr:hypothetical protein [Thioalkalivibrio sp. ALJ16]
MTRRFAQRDPMIPSGPAKAYLDRPAPKRDKPKAGPVRRVKAPRSAKKIDRRSVLNLLPVNFSMEQAEAEIRRENDPNWTELDCAAALGCTVGDLERMRRAGTGPDYTETRDGIRYSLAAITYYMLDTNTGRK